MASGKSSKAMRNARGSVGGNRSIPWITIAGATVLLLVGGVVFGYAYFQWSDQQARRAATAPFQPSQENPDPSTKIEGVVKKDYKAQQHVTSEQRVAYDQAPPFGGPHGQIWADCTGTVYEQPVRSENMVHSLEHGAVWITYDPERVGGQALQKLADRVEGKPYTMLSPYPGLDSPVSLQSWEHQLKVDSVDDVRIDQFITALRKNDHGVYPEIGGSCQAYPGMFDPQNPPPFEAGPPPPDAVTMDGEGAMKANGDMGAPSGR